MQQLHNVLQARNKVNQLSWMHECNGTQHRPGWTAVVLSNIISFWHPLWLLTGELVDGIEYAKATARTKKEAREEAAQSALEKL